MLALHSVVPTDFIGWASCWPAAVIALYAVLARWSMWRDDLPAIGPVLFLVLALLSHAGPFASNRWFPDADEFLGYYLLLSAAGICGMELARRGTLYSLVFGEAFLFVAGVLLSLEIIHAAQYRLSGSIAFPVNNWPLACAAMIWLPFFVVVSRRVSLRYRRARRVERGCCPECGYDLRASSDRCPECGHSPPIARPIEPAAAAGSNTGH